MDSEKNLAFQSIRKIALSIAVLAVLYVVAHFFWSNPDINMDKAVKPSQTSYLHLTYVDTLLEQRFTVAQINGAKTKAEALLNDERAQLLDKRKRVLVSTAQFFCSFLPVGEMPPEIAAIVVQEKKCLMRGEKVPTGMEAEYSMAPVTGIIQSLEKYSGKMNARTEILKDGTKAIPIDSKKETLRAAVLGQLKELRSAERDAVMRAQSEFYGLSNPLDFLWTNGMVLRFGKSSCQTGASGTTAESVQDETNSQTRCSADYDGSAGWMLELFFWSLLGFLVKSLVAAVSAYENGEFDKEKASLTLYKSLVAPVVGIVLIAFMLTGFTDTTIKLWNGGLMLALSFSLGFGSERAMLLLRAGVEKLLPKVFSVTDQAMKKALVTERLRTTIASPRKLDATGASTSIDELKRVAINRARAVVEGPVLDTVVDRYNN